MTVDLDQAPPRRRLELGMPVRADDGDFGELADLIVDPHTNEITHLVVEPHHQHLQSRLVPLWLATVENDEIRVGLDLRHLRELARVSFSEYVELGKPIEVGDEWDVGDLTLHALPYWSEITPSAWAPTVADAHFDRIPKDEIEIRRTSAVRSNDGRLLGHVNGFVVSEGDIFSVVVTAGLPGLRHDVVVPVGSVEMVGADEIRLTINADDFHDLPDATPLRTPDGCSAGGRTDLARSRERIGRAISGRVQRVSGPVLRALRR